MTRDELIAALEAATGPDRDLDWKIARVARGNTDCRYTESIDAALKLVPEGWCPAIWQNVHHFVWSAHVQKVNDAKDIISHGATSKTAPIALCIAALKAGA